MSGNFIKENPVLFALLCAVAAIIILLIIYALYDFLNKDSDTPENTQNTHDRTRTLTNSANDIFVEHSAPKKTTQKQTVQPRSNTPAQLESTSTNENNQSTVKLEEIQQTLEQLGQQTVGNKNFSAAAFANVNGNISRLEDKLDANKEEIVGLLNQILTNHMPPTYDNDNATGELMKKLNEKTHENDLANQKIGELKTKLAKKNKELQTLNRKLKEKKRPANLEDLKVYRCEQITIQKSDITEDERDNKNIINRDNKSIINLRETDNIGRRHQ